MPRSKFTVPIFLGLSLGFATVLALTLGVSYVGWDNLIEMRDRVEKADDTNRLVKLLQDSRIQEKNFII